MAPAEPSHVRSDADAVREHYRQLLGNLPVIVWAVDQDGVYTVSDGRGLESLGLSPGEVLGRNVFEMYPENKAIERSIRRAFGGESFIETIHVGDLAFDSHYAPIRDESGAIVGVQGIALDVTERARATKALRESTERLQRIYDAANDAILILDPETGRFIDANPSAEKLLGYSRNELLGLDVARVHPDDLEETRSFVTEVLAAGTGFTDTLRCHAKNGHRIETEISASTLTLDGKTMILAMVRDVSGRRKSEQALRLSEERTKLIVNHVPIIAWEWDRASRRFTYVAGRAEQLLGYSLDAWLEPEFWIRTIHADDRERVLADSKHHTDARNDHQLEYRLIAADGRTVWVRDMVSIPTEPGTASLLRGVMIDITDQKDAELRISRTTQSLQLVRDRLARLLDAASDIQLAQTEDEAISIVANAIRSAGWDAVAVNLFDANWRIVADAYAGLTPHQIQDLRSRRVSPTLRAAMFGPKREPFLVGRSYFIPAEVVPTQILSSSVMPGRRMHVEGDTWHAHDIAYIPMHDSTSAVIGRITIDDPIDGQRPDAATFRYLESFADLAARHVENLRLRARDNDAQRAIAESEERFRAIFEQSPDAIAVIDFDTMLPIQFNDAAANMLGYTRDEFKRLALPDINTTMDPAEVRARVDQIRTDDAMLFENKHRRKDGTFIDVLISARRVSLDGRDVLLAIRRDISEHKRAAEAVARSEEQLRIITDAAPVLISYVDRDEVYRFNNKAYEHWFRKPRSEIIGRSLREALGPDQYARYQPMIRAALAGIPVEYEQSIEFLDGRRGWFRAIYRPDIAPDGSVRGFFAVIVDITDIKRSEVALRESEQRFRTMGDSTAALIWMSDPDRSRIYVNRSFLELTASHESDHLGDKWLELLHPDDRASVNRIFDERIPLHRPIECEYRLRAASGEYRWILEQCVPRFLPDGTFAGYIGTGVDITDRKQADDQLRQTSEHRRLLLHELDHRVKNALGSLLSLIDLCHQDQLEVDEFARSIRTRVRAMAEVHNLLSASHWSAIGLRDLIRSVLFTQQEAHIELDGPDVLIPPRQSTALGMVIQELASNSLKHGALSAPGAHLRVYWTLGFDAPRARLRLDLHWFETGGPPAPREPKPGLGTSLILGFTRSELGGDASLRFTPDGVRHQITVYLDPGHEPVTQPTS